MKKHIIYFAFVVLLISVFSCHTPQNKAIVVAKLQNCKDSIVMVNYIGKTDTIKLDKEHKFSLEIELSKPIWLKLGIAGNSITLYVQPGSEINLNFDYTSFDKPVKIDGTDSEINQYLLKQNSEFDGHICNNVSFKYESEPLEYFEALKNLEKQLQTNYDEFVAKYGTKHRHFADNEKLRLKYMLASSKIDYSKFVDYSTSLTEEQKSNYYTFIKDINLNLPENENLHEYYSFASMYVDWKANSNSSGDNSKILSDLDYINFVFEVIKTDFKDKKIIEYLYFEKLYDFMLYYGVENLQQAFDEFMKMSTNLNHKNELNILYNKWQDLAKGKPAPIFVCNDVNYKEHDISEFAGKLVVIDVWASWCGPCMYEIPYMEKLKKEYAKKPVAFVAVSVDDNRENWIAELEKSKLTGNQWFANGWNNDLCISYYINSIPRFIVIDQNGNIVNTNAPRPSGDLKQLIDSWLEENKTL